MEGITKTFTVKGTKGVSARVTVTETYDIAANTSTLSVAVAVACANYYGHTYYLNGTISAGGQTLQTMRSTAGTHHVTVSKLNTYYPIRGSGAPGSPWSSGAIAHNTDGSKSVTVAVDFKGYEGSGNGANGFSVSGSATVDLTHIPRASTVGATDANIGAVSMVAVSRKSTEYTHSIAFSFGGISGYLTQSGEIADAEQKFAATSIPFAIPESFYSAIPNAPSAACSLSCTTYLGQTQIGEKQSGSFTVTAPAAQCAPVITAQVTDTNETAVALTGDSAALIRYASQALCRISAQPRFGAVITETAVDGVAVEDSVIRPAAERYTFTATDSRGYKTQCAVTPRLVPYVNLTCRATAKRDDPTSGKATLTVSGECYQGTFGAAENRLNLRFRVGSGTWTALDPTFSGHTYTAAAAVTDLHYTQRHTITVEASDALTAATATAAVEKGIPVFDWGENDFRFHVPVNMHADIELNNHNLLKNGVPLGAADVGAAPTGYGLGGNSKYISTSYELDALVANCNYLYAGGNHNNNILVDGYGITYGYGRVDNYDGSCARQTLVPLVPRIDTTLVRYFANGGWIPWEWENPPLSPGVEYLTTEWYSGSPVYKKLVSFGALPDKSTKNVALNITGGANGNYMVIGYEAFARSTASIVANFPIVNNSMTILAKIHVSSTNITVVTSTSMSDYTGTVILKYIKS